MHGGEKERYEELCELASKERGPKKLIELIREIDRLMEARRKRLPGEVPPEP